MFESIQPKAPDIEPTVSLDHAAKIAADWWSKQLAGTSDGAFLSRVSSIVPGGYPAACTDASTLQNFEQTLVSLIKQEFANNPWAHGLGVSVENDYYPKELLLAALEAANIKTDIAQLPWQTSTVVFLDRVEVKGKGKTVTITVADTIKQS